MLRHLPSKFSKNSFQNSRAITEQLPSNYRAIIEQFQSKSGTGSEQKLRHLAAQNQAPTYQIPEQFPSSFRAVSEQFPSSCLPAIKNYLARWNFNRNYEAASINKHTEKSKHSTQQKRIITTTTKNPKQERKEKKKKKKKKEKKEKKSQPE